MTIEQVIQVVEDETGQKVTGASELKDLGMDSLEFLELIVKLNIPDAAVPAINTVQDLQEATC